MVEPTGKRRDGRLQTGRTHGVGDLLGGHAGPGGADVLNDGGVEQIAVLRPQPAASSAPADPTAASRAATTRTPTKDGNGEGRLREPCHAEAGEGGEQHVQGEAEQQQAAQDGAGRASRSRGDLVHGPAQVVAVEAMLVGADHRLPRRVLKDAVGRLGLHGVPPRVHGTGESSAEPARVPADRGGHEDGEPVAASRAPRA